MGVLIYRDCNCKRELLGRIDYEREQESRFCYDQAYLTRARAAGELGVSERLPLDAAPYSAQEFGAFFRGLLPEGEVYADLIEMYQLTRNDYLALLEQLGCESIGALTLVSEDADLAEYVPDYRPLDEELLATARRDPVRMAAQTASSTRLSLAGAQSKVAWCLPEGVSAREASMSDWLVPVGTAPSSHIVKVSRKGEESIALNEYVCSLLSAACGIETATVTLVPEVAGMIAVERYDREWVDCEGGRGLARRHQEDFCQALGLQPFYKYQPEGVRADYLCMIADLLDAASANPQADKAEFAKRLVFNYLVGNTDIHLKNSSLLYNARWTGRRLAPSYDVTCIPLTGYSTKMPFDIGKHRALAEIDENDIMSIALDLDVALDELDHVIDEVIGGVQSACLEGAGSEAEEMAARILDDARDRIVVLNRFRGC